jgi:hypothetical protein
MLKLGVRVKVFKGHFQQYFSYIVAVNFTDEENWLLTNYIT